MTAPLGESKAQVPDKSSVTQGTVVAGSQSVSASNGKMGSYSISIADKDQLRALKMGSGLAFGYLIGQIPESQA